MPSTFVKVSRAEWKFDGRVKDPRRSRLLAAAAYESLCRQVAANATIISVRWVPLKEKKGSNLEKGLKRTKIFLQAPIHLVDAFHNSRFGYRAQFYSSISTGKRADKYMRRLLLNRLLPELKARRSRNLALHIKSLHAPGAKVWIKEGCWWRTAKWRGATLKVERWRKCPADRGKALLKKRWGGQAPPREDRLVLIGGLLTKQGRPAGDHKPGRGEEIYNWGFT